MSINQVGQWLCPQQILLDVQLRDRWHALETAAMAIGHTQGLDSAPILRALWRREQSASTAIGKGVAIPHARIAGIHRPLTLFIRAKPEIAFDAPDGGPVANILTIMVPADGANEDHLELLALVAQMFSDRAFRRRLAASANASQTESAFAAWADRIAPRLDRR